MLTNLFHLSLPQLIQAAGYVGLFFIIVAETGLPFGFIFPGDSLLFAAGLLASQGVLGIVPLALVITSAAIIGDNIGYMLGSTLGPRLFSGKAGLFFTEHTRQRTEAFFTRYGMRAIILARFIPTIRTFAPMFAGLGNMHYRSFLLYNVVGAVLWGAGLTYLGYALGTLIPGIDHYLVLIVIGIIIISALPVTYEVWKARTRSQ